MKKYISYNNYGGGDSVGYIATRYGLYGPEFELSGGEIFCTRPYRPRGPPRLLYNGYRVRSKAAGAWC
jgi:hypothetical protein